MFWGPCHHRVGRIPREGRPAVLRVGCAVYTHRDARARALGSSLGRGWLSGGASELLLGRSAPGARRTARFWGCPGQGVCEAHDRSVTHPQDKLDGFVPAHFIGWYLKVR